MNLSRTVFRVCSLTNPLSKLLLIVLNILAVHYAINAVFIAYGRHGAVEKSTVNLTSSSILPTGGNTTSIVSIHY